MRRRLLNTIGMPALVGAIFLFAPPSHCCGQGWFKNAKRAVQRAVRDVAEMKKELFGADRQRVDERPNAVKRKDWIKDPNVKQQVQRQEPVVQAYLGSRLTIAKIQCQATDEQVAQMKKLAPAEYRKIREVLVEFWAWNFGVARRDGRERPNRNITTMIDKAVEKIVREVFSPEESKAYFEELDASRQFDAKSGAMTLVTYMDEELYLNDEQRAALVDLIANEWQPEWEYYYQVLPHNPQFFPKLPDDEVAEILSDAQQKKWKGSQRSHLSSPMAMYTHLGIFGNQKDEDNEWFDGVDEANNHLQQFQFLVPLNR